jgi:hypothetical protein
MKGAMGMNRSAWGDFIGYFKARPWLVTWLAIFAVSLVVLAVAGQIHTQGDGYPTAYELGAIGIYAGIWIAAKVFFKTDLTEEYLLGLIFGIQWEFLTEPYWTYLPDRFNVLVWKDIPLLMLMGWGAAFTLSLLLSHWFARKIFKLDVRKMVFDWKILFCDAVAVSIVGVAGEWLYGILLGCWVYNVDFGIGKSPLGLGWEIHIGYVIVMFWYGTTLRVWKLKLEGALPVDGGRS